MILDGLEKKSVMKGEISPQGEGREMASWSLKTSERTSDQRPRMRWMSLLGSPWEG